MGAKHSVAAPAHGPASARQIVTGLWRIIVELDELAAAAPPKWTERIDEVSATAQSVIGEIIGQRAGAAGAPERRVPDPRGPRKSGS